VSVYCGEPVLGDEYQDTILNPTLIIEVLSPSTEAYDRGKKFAAYRSIESLREYALVSQIEPIIEVFFKDSGGTWSLSVSSGLDATCKFRSLDIEIPLAEIYRGVKLEPPSVYYG
jgi:Uma2 family endonuclease